MLFRLAVANSEPRAVVALLKLPSSATKSETTEIVPRATLPAFARADNAALPTCEPKPLVCEIAVADNANAPLTIDRALACIAMRDTIAATPEGELRAIVIAALRAANAAR